MVQGISTKGPSPNIIPYWQVDSDRGRVLPQAYGAGLFSEYRLGFIPAETLDRLRIRQTLRRSPFDQAILLEETRVVRGKILHQLWKLQDEISGTSPDISDFIQENLFIPWEGLKILAGSDHRFKVQAQQIKELRQSIHQLKVIALKRGEGPAWVEAQIQNICGSDPYLFMLALPVLHASASVPNEPLSRLQALALEKGYQLYFGPFPLDPLNGRPEFLALRWIRDSLVPEGIKPQWGVLSEDGFFNTRPEALLRMTAALGLYTLPDKTRHESLRIYARNIFRIHEGLYHQRGEEALPFLESAQTAARDIFLAADPLIFQRWRAMAKSKKHLEPIGEDRNPRNTPLRPENERVTRWLDCSFPLWPNLPQGLCLAFLDQSGKAGIFDGRDEWGFLEEPHEFNPHLKALAENLKNLGIIAIPEGTPYEVMDRYVRHLNRAYQLATGETLAYPSVSLHQIMEDLRNAFGAAAQARIPLNHERYRRITQDALMLFWDSVPDLIAFKYSNVPNPNEEKIGLLFTAHQELIRKEFKALQVAAKVLERDPQEMVKGFNRLGLKILEHHMTRESTGASLKAQYTLRLLLDFLPVDDLQGLAAPMQQLALSRAEQGRTKECLHWLTSADLVLQSAGTSLNPAEFTRILAIARSNEAKPQAEAPRVDP